MAVEMVLVKEGGYSLDEIRGYEETHTSVHPPDPLAAALSGLWSRRVRGGVGVLVAFGLLYAAATGALGAVVLSLLASFLLYLAKEVDAEPEVVKTTVERDGMDSEEVLSRLVQHDEHEQMKKEEAEDKARKARRQAQSGGQQ